MHLEVLKHDGPARLGILKAEVDIPTPNFFSITLGMEMEHDIYLVSKGIGYKNLQVIDYGSLKIEKEIKEFGILPDEHVGLNVPKSIAEFSVENTIKFAEKYPDYGAVIQGSKFVELRKKCAEAFRNRPLVVIADGSKLIKKQKLLVEIVPTVREAISPNSALYFPLAPPHMFPLLAYMGVDLFDSGECVIKARENKLITPRGFLNLEELKELPCACSICRDKKPAQLNFNDILKHNFNIAVQIIREIRQRIRDNTFREFVEEKAASDVKSMKVLRILDREKQDFLERYTPVVYSNKPLSYSKPENKLWK